MRPLAHHLILGSQAHTQPSDAPSVIEGSWEEWGCLPKGHKETSGADGYIHNMTAVVGLGEEGDSRGKEWKRMKTQESQVLLLRNYVTSVGKSTFLSPNVLTCKGGLNHVAPGWAVRIKRSTLCTADTASTAPACRKSMLGANLIPSSPFSHVHKHRYQKASSCRTTNTRGNWS